jgi:hypothetical protein
MCLYAWATKSKPMTPKSGVNSGKTSMFCQAQTGKFIAQQNLPAALAAVPWLLACSALRARGSRTKHKRDACFVLCREALRANLVTQIGFSELINDTSVTKRQVNSTLSAIIAKLMLYCKIILIAAFLVALASCTSGQRKRAQFKWGQTFATVAKNEKDRLGQQPFARNNFPNTDLTSAAYHDNFMNSRCYLTYWFDMDSLQMVSYSCSNPDWDEAELKRFVGQKLDSLYGPPISILIGNKSHDYYRAKDANIYFRMTRIHQTTEVWRTFQANIFFSHFPHDSYKILEGVLSTYGR